MLVIFLSGGGESVLKIRFGERISVDRKEEGRWTLTSLKKHMINKIHRMRSELEKGFSRLQPCSAGVN